MIFPQKYFVMLRLHNGNPVPLCNEDETTALFDSEDAADLAAENNLLGIAGGWETYQWFVDGEDEP